MSDLDDAAAVLASVVPFGDAPTPRANELAAAVARHVSGRSAAPKDEILVALDEIIPALIRIRSLLSEGK